MKTTQSVLLRKPHVDSVTILASAKNRWEIQHVRNKRPLRKGAGNSRRGFTLIEAALATVIIGIGVVSLLELLAAGSMSNGAATELTLAASLANNIHEISIGLPFTDPVNDLHHDQGVRRTDRLQRHLGLEWRHLLAPVGRYPACGLGICQLGPAGDCPVGPARRAHRHAAQQYHSHVRPGAGRGHPQRTHHLYGKLDCRRAEPVTRLS